MPNVSCRNSVLLLVLISLMAGPVNNAQAQDLEPRRWSHLPVGLSVLGLGLAAVDGDILFDPVLQAEDVSYELNLVGLSYVRAFDFFGKTGRLDVVAPVARGRWEGTVSGENTVLHREGLVDPWIRFSVNLYGAPALKGEEFMRYRTEKQTNTIVGAGLTVIAPLGQYEQSQLINLGSNRWIIRPQLGVLHQRRKWQFELTGSVFLYQTNDEFWNGTVREQDPLWFLQGHAIYTINPRWWTSLSFGYAHGGRSTIDGNPKLDDSRTSFMALALGYNINRSQGIKLSYLRGRTNTSLGKDTDTISLGWSFRWAK